MMCRAICGCASKSKVMSCDVYYQLFDEEDFDLALLSCPYLLSLTLIVSIWVVAIFPV